MPIYTYRCPQCGIDDEDIVPMENRDDIKTHSCGTKMKRIIEVPRLILMKQTGKGMALDTLNNKDTNHMKPEMKTQALQGLEEPPKIFY